MPKFMSRRRYGLSFAGCICWKQSPITRSASGVTGAWRRVRRKRLEVNFELSFVFLRVLGGCYMQVEPQRARRNTKDNSKLTSSRFRRTLRQAPVTPLALLVIGDCFQQMHPAKLRP